jgi:steroid delta-isomerase-like uncharacterized protein
MTIPNSSAVVLSQEQLADFDRRWLAAWNELDIEALVAMCAPGVVYDDPSLPAPARGRDEARAFFAAIAGAYPNLKIAVLSPPLPVPASAMALSRYRLTATMTGPFAPANLAPTGATMTFEGVDEWTFEDGLLSHCRTYYDTIAAARQLGILPAVGSRVEKLMARLQHAQARRQRRRAGLT